MLLIEFNSNLTVSRVWNTGETGDLHTFFGCIFSSFLQVFPIYFLRCENAEKDNFEWQTVWESTHLLIKLQNISLRIGESHPRVLL